MNELNKSNDAHSTHISVPHIFHTYTTDTIQAKKVNEKKNLYVYFMAKLTLINRSIALFILDPINKNSMLLSSARRCHHHHYRYDFIVFTSFFCFWKSYTLLLFPFAYSLENIFHIIKIVVCEFCIIYATCGKQFCAVLSEFWLIKVSFRFATKFDAI